MEDWSYKLREFWEEADRETRAAILVATLGIVGSLLTVIFPPPVHQIRIVE